MDTYSIICECEILVDFYLAVAKTTTKLPKLNFPPNFLATQ